MNKIMILSIWIGLISIAHYQGFSQQVINMHSGSVQVEEFDNIFYDSGGEVGNYQNNENHTLTVYGPLDPHGGTGFGITFYFFNIEDSPDCSFDRLIIYDGEDTSGEILGIICGESFVPIPCSGPSYTTNGNALTFQFISNQSETDFGWSGTFFNFSTATPTFRLCNNDLYDFEITPCQMQQGEISPPTDAAQITECADPIFQEVVYKYIATQTGQIEIELFSTHPNTRVYFGHCETIQNPCGGYQAYECTDDGKCILLNVTAGTTYYLLVDGGNVEVPSYYTLILRDHTCNSFNCNCPLDYNPVCTEDGKVFPNPCFAMCAGYFNFESANGSCSNTCYPTYHFNPISDNNPLSFDFSSEFNPDSIAYFTIYNIDQEAVEFDYREVQSIADLIYHCPVPGRYRFCFYVRNCEGDVHLKDELIGSQSPWGGCCTYNICCFEVCALPYPEEIECGINHTYFFQPSCIGNYLGDFFVPCSPPGSIFDFDPVRARLFKIAHQGGAINIELFGSLGAFLYQGNSLLNIGSKIACPDDFINLGCDGGVINRCQYLYHNDNLPPGDYLLLVTTIEDTNFDLSINCCDDTPGVAGVNCAPILHAFQGVLPGGMLQFQFEVAQSGITVEEWEIDGVEQSISGNILTANFADQGFSYPVQICWLVYDFTEACFKRCCRTFCIQNPLDCDFTSYHLLSNGNYRLEVTDPEFTGNLEWILDNHPDGALLLGTGNDLEINLSLYSGLISGDFLISARYGTPGCWRYCCIWVPKPHCQQVQYQIYDQGSEAGLGAHFTHSEGLEGNWYIVDGADTINIAQGANQVDYFNPYPGVRRICWWRINPSNGIHEICCRDFCFFDPYACASTRHVPINPTRDRFEFVNISNGQNWVVTNESTGQQITLNQQTPEYTYPGPGIYTVCGYFLNSCGYLQWCCFTRCISSPNTCYLHYGAPIPAGNGTYNVAMEFGNLVFLDSLTIEGIDSINYESTIYNVSLQNGQIILPFPGYGRYRVCYYVGGMSEIPIICCKTIYIYPCWSLKYRPIGDLIYRFENPDNIPVSGWELSDQNGTILGTFYGNNTIIEFPSHGEYFVTPIILYPDNCDGYKGCKWRICVSSVFSCDVVYQRPRPIPVGGGYRYFFDLINVSDANHVQWYIDEIPGSNVSGSSVSFDFGPEFYGRELTVSVIYFDGYCWRICCRRICIVNPFACGAITWRPRPIPTGGIALEFSLPQNFSDANWELHRPDGTLIASGAGSDFTTEISDFNNPNFVISVSYFDGNCWRICCLVFCLPDPLACRSIRPRPYPDLLPNNNFGYIASLEDDAESISWYWHDAMGNLISGAEGTGAEATIEFNGGFEGEVFITYKYFWGGCWRICCRRICVRNPYTCGLFNWRILNVGGPQVTYEFSSQESVASGAEIDWEILDFMTEEVIGTSQASEWSLGLIPGRMYHVIFRYFNPVTKCWIVCCRKLCVEDPFACGNIRVRPLPSLSGLNYEAELDVDNAVDIEWQIDEISGLAQSGGTTFYIDFTDYGYGDYTVSIRYRVGNCWFICCRRICAYLPSNCTKLSTTTTTGSDVILLDGGNDVESYYVFNQEENLVTTLPGSASSYTLPIPGGYWFCGYFFNGVCWEYCCFYYSDCPSQIDCGGIVLNPFGQNLEVQISGSLGNNTPIDSIRITGPDNYFITVAGNLPTFNCPVPGNYRFCFYYVDECGNVRFCCLDYCADNWTYPCRIGIPVRQTGNDYLVEYEGDEEVISWELDGQQISSGGTEVEFTVGAAREYEICVVRRTLCGRILQKCCVSYCLGAPACIPPGYSVNLSSQTVLFSSVDSDTLKVYNAENNQLINEIELDGQSQYIYQAPGFGRYRFCFSYITSCGTVEYCCIDDVCIGVNPLCPPFIVIGNNGLSIQLSVNVPSSTNVSWTMGDGQTRTGTTINYTYAQPGSYRVCYTIFNNCGSCTYCEDIIVAPAGTFAIKYGKISGEQNEIVSLPIIVASGGMQNVVDYQTYAILGDKDVAIFESIVLGYDGWLNANASQLGDTVSITIGRFVPKNITVGDTIGIIRYRLTGEPGDTTEVIFAQSPTRPTLFVNDQQEIQQPLLFKGCLIIASTALSLSGKVSTWPSAFKAIEVATVEFSSNSVLINTEITNTQGIYSGNSLQPGAGGLQLKVRKSTGQSIASLAGPIQAATILKQFNSGNLFSQQWQFIASDYDCNGIVNSFDAQAIMRVSFGYPSFINEPCNSLEWIFVPKIHALPMANASTWYPFQQQLNIPAGSSNVDADFYGVFRGDVLQRADTRKSETLFFYAEDKENLSTGEMIEMPVYGLNFEDISSFGFGLVFDTADVEFEGFENPSFKNHLIFWDENKANEGVLALGWVDFDVMAGKTQPDSVSVMTLKWRVKTNNAKLSNLIQFDEEIYPAQGTNSDLDILRVFFTYDLNSVSTLEHSSDSYELYQNMPNPFKDETIIQYHIPRSEKVTFEIFDALGKMIFHSSEYRQAGSHKIPLLLNESSGAFYYRLRTDAFSATKKMIKY